MACPFFVPVRRLEWTGPGPAPRLPLGDSYAGECHTGPEVFEPPAARQRDVCNCGYASGRCDRFEARGTDAVRFSVTLDEPERLELVWVLEKDHAPASYGMLEYDVASQCVRGEAPGGTLRRQVEKFVESYLRLRQRLPDPA